MSEELEQLISAIPRFSLDEKNLYADKFNQLLDTKIARESFQLFRNSPQKSWCSARTSWRRVESQCSVGRCSF